MAQIQIWTRDVDPTNGLLWGTIPQHTFLIKVNDDGTREILRGGPINNNMITDDIGIIRMEYDQNAIDYFDPSGPDHLHHQFQTIKTSSQSEIDVLWESAWSKAQEINNGHYDYEPFTQNCNTTTALMADTMGIKNEVESFLSDAAHVWTPGLDLDFNQSLPDKIYDLITNPTDSFKEILEFAQNNPTLQTEIGNVSDFINTVKSSLDSLLQDATTIGTFISNLLHNLTAAEAVTPAIRRYDPLALDLNHNGTIDLVSLHDSNAFFDITGNGLQNKVGWIQSGDGLLVLDSNSNGVVDNIDELFGYAEENGNRVTGTDELATYDSNLDGKIDSSDAVFNQLRVWQDFNRDGITDSYWNVGGKSTNL